MKTYLLPKNGNFYKANLHTHTTLSDGRLTPEEVKELYQKYGYSIVAYTDHEVFMPHNELTDESFLALNGYEGSAYDSKGSTAFHVRKTTHICFIAKKDSQSIQPCWNGNTRFYNDKTRHLVKFDESKPYYVPVYSAEGINEYTKLVKEAGFFVIYNHPGWSYEDYTNYMGYDNMDAMEIFNGSSILGGYDDYNPRVYDDMLRGGKRLYCVGADDNHNIHPENARGFDSARGFTVIKAEQLTYPCVINALENGHFYASEGPEIYDLYVEDRMLHVKSSPADRINCNYGIRCAQTKADENGIPVTEAVFQLPENFGYFRITVIDKQGRHACSNAYFEDDVP